MKLSVKKLVRGGLIAALYVALTLALAPIAFGPVQLRVSEALTALPLLLPEAVPGLFIGCLIANVFGNLLGMSVGPFDIVFGSLATLISAYLTYRLRKRPALGMAPPVLVNAVVVGLVLNLTLGFPLLLSMAQVGLGQAVACFALGLPLYYLMKKLPGRLLD